MLVLADYEQRFVHTYLLMFVADNERWFGRQRKPGRVGTLGSGGIDLSCWVEPPSCLALVLCRVVRVCRYSSLAPFLGNPSGNPEGFLKESPGIPRGIPGGIPSECLGNS